MNSCIYRGVVSHQRFSPVAHRFTYRLYMIYLDLGELDTVFAGRWLWSTRRPAVAWFRRRDHFGDPSVPLDRAVRETVERLSGITVDGPVRLLTHLRYFGYCFNPISIFYCFDGDGRTLKAVLAEVTNTPWGERRCYVLPAAPSDTDANTPLRFEKTLHVSPFMPMDLDYVWHSNVPGAKLAVQLEVLQGETRLLNAALALRREEIGPDSLAACLARHPLMTLEVIAGIHWQALWLWKKGVPIFDHPKRQAGAADR
ncbi:MAG: DUF1365 domain-containing protein [Methylotetracoccus sp.]